MWRRRLLESPKAAGHWGRGQAKGRAPLWVLPCTVRWLLEVKAEPHRPHTNFLTPGS